MPSFTKGGTASGTFGNNNFLRSTKSYKTESYTLAAATVTAQTINSVPGQKIAPKGLVLAKITSGGDIGKVGPYQGGTLVSEIQTVAITGTPTGGTYRLAFNGEATSALAHNANAAAIQAALLALPGVGVGDLSVTGAGPFTVTFAGNLAGQNLSPITLDTNSLTGGTAPSVTIATTTQGGVSAGAATDGREDPLNIVGINNTFLPWQLMERDVEVAVVYDASVIQGWCYEYDAAGALAVLSNATAMAMNARKGLNILFK